MPLKVKIIKARVNSKTVLGAAASISSITAQVADICQFPPARAAASLLLIIFETIQHIENNKESCYRLAHKAAKILIDIRNRMEGKWENAPKSLLENIQQFENTLKGVRDYMEALSKVKWMGRLVQRYTIDSALSDYEKTIDEAERSFHTATLVEIHYAVGLIHQQYVTSSSSPKAIEASKTSEPEPESIQPRGQTLPPSYGQIEEIVTEPESIDTTVIPSGTVVASPSSSLFSVEEDALRLQEELQKLDSYGFTRYHQSDVKLRHGVRTSDPFWSDSAFADVAGKKTVVKRYDGKGDSATKKWLHDIKMLRNTFHPNLPQMVGFSDDNSATPFIIMEKVQLRDMNAFMKKAMLSQDLGACANHMLRMYRDISSAILYMQRQMSFDDSKTQDFVEGASFSLDGDNNVIVGLPPPPDAEMGITTFRFRSYGLTESLVDACLKALPNSDVVNKLLAADPKENAVLERRFKHLKAIAGVLLPKKSDSPELSEAIEELLNEGEDAELRDLRSVTLSNGGHDYYWTEYVHRCEVDYKAGYFGIVPRKEGKLDFHSFIKVGDVFEREGNTLAVVNETTGLQWQWANRFVERQDVWPFLLPDDLQGWPVSLPPNEEVNIDVRHSSRVTSVNDAWKYLLENAKSLVEGQNIEPYDLILVTGAARTQTYSAQYMAPNSRSSFSQRPGFGNQHFGGGFGGNQFGGRGMHNNHFHSPFNQDVPIMKYLFTSDRVGHAAFWSDRPHGTPDLPTGRSTSRLVHEKTGWPGTYVDYIQLEKDDL